MRLQNVLFDNYVRSSLKEQDKSSNVELHLSRKITRTLRISCRRPTCTYGNKVCNQDSIKIEYQTVRRPVHDWANVC